MWSQARNNRELVRATPAVPNTICVITRSRIAMTTTDINLSAEQVRSTERARRRSLNSRNALRGTYVAVQTFWISYPDYSLATNSLASQSELLQNTATKTKLIIIFFFLDTGRLYFIYYSSFSDLTELNDYKHQYTIKRSKTVSKCR